MNTKIETDKETINSLRNLAEQGDAEAQFKLSQCLQGIDSNEEESLKWLRKAAEQGFGYAQFLLAKHLSNDWSVENDEATEWLYKASDGASGEAQYELGEYLLKRKKTGDDVKAIKLFKKAARKNNADAQYMLGMFYLHGTGLQKDKAKGMKWLRKAAKQDYRDALEEIDALSYGDDEPVKE